MKEVIKAVVNFIFLGSESGEDERIELIVNDR